MFTTALVVIVPVALCRIHTPGVYQLPPIAPVAVPPVMVTLLPVPSAWALTTEPPAIAMAPPFVAMTYPSIAPDTSVRSPPAPT